MNVENMIQSMFDQWPELFQTRADCLDCIFCSPTDSFLWKNGEIYPKYESDLFQKNPLKDGKAFQYKVLTLKDRNKNYMEFLIRNAKTEILQSKSFQNEINHMERKLLEIPENAIYEYPRKYRWYFFMERKESANYFHVPKDAAKEWLEAFDELNKMLEEDDYKDIIPDTEMTPKEFRQSCEKKNKIKEQYKGYYTD